ncbi:Protein of unknown function [Flavobacterium aquidurense]|nr:Protein of unknown function [Flavobacterium aquidurense]
MRKKQIFNKTIYYFHFVATHLILSVFITFLYVCKLQLTSLLKKKMLQNQSIIPDIKAIIATSKESAIRAVDNERTRMYWSIGKRIFEEEQQGKERADYGTYLIRFLAEQLQPEYGSGFSYRQLNWYR